jgi:hypothetical protein
LDAAGAASYGGFLHQRVAAMINIQESQRHEVSAAVSEHRLAQAAWTAMVGDVDVEWALVRQAAIAAAAGSAGDIEGATLALKLARASQPDPRELAELLMARIAKLEEVGASGESLPLILDEPFEGLDQRAKRWLLELLVRSAGPQIVLLTDDADVIDWARGEEAGGSLAVMSPAPSDAKPGLRIAG